MSDKRPITAQRLEQLLADRVCSQEDLAEGLGVTQSAISQIITGKTRRSRLLPQIAEFLKVNLSWLLGTTDERVDMFDDDGEPISEGDLMLVKAGMSDRRLAYRSPEPDPEPEHDPADIVWLREADVVLGLGGGFLDTDVETRLVPFPALWVRQFSDAPANLLSFLPVRGTSMEPTITDRSMCLIDHSRTTIDEQDELWACVYGGIGMVKRLRQLPDGSVKVMSDNKAVSAEIAADNDLYIMGRCCGVLRRT